MSEVAACVLGVEEGRAVALLSSVLGPLVCEDGNPDSLRICTAHARQRKASAHCEPLQHALCIADDRLQCPALEQCCIRALPLQLGQHCR